MITSRTHVPSGSTGRPEILAILGSTLTVIAIIAIVTFLLIRERAGAQQAATRSATTIAQLIDADVLRTVELYDLSLQGLIAASQRDDLKQVSAQIRHLALFDRSTSARFKGGILLLAPNGEVLADSSRIDPKPGNFSDRDYFLAHAGSPDSEMFISRPSDDNDGWRIHFSRRISSATGEFLGVAVASMRLSYFDQLFKSLDIGEGGILSIISDDGILLAQKPHLENDPIGRSFADRSNVQRILRERNFGLASIASLGLGVGLPLFNRRDRGAVEQAPEQPGQHQEADDQAQRPVHVEDGQAVRRLLVDQPEQVVHDHIGQDERGRARPVEQPCHDAEAVAGVFPGHRLLSLSGPGTGFLP